LIYSSSLQNIFQKKIGKKESTIYGHEQEEKQGSGAVYGVEGRSWLNSVTYLLFLEVR
jgi:hypothetical protein